MKELVVISGKCGTGKTSIVAAFAALAKNAVLADCDVDAADLHLVLEPKVKQTHDLDRVSELTSSFGIKTLVCINKADVNQQITEQISKDAQKRGLKVIGKIAYDEAFTKAQMIKASVVEYTSGAITEQIKALWRQVTYTLGY